MFADKKVWFAIFSAKALLVLVVVAAMHARFNLGQFHHVFAKWPPGEEPTFASYFSTWDGAHYLRLSEYGYKAGSLSCAFYPLWPAFISLGTAVVKGWPVTVSMLSANALSLIGFWLLYGLVARRCGPAIGRDSLVLMLASPGALFFSFPYSESLYLVILMVFLWGLELGRWEWLASAGFLLPLTRPLGIFILLPLAWHFRESYFGALRWLFRRPARTARNAQGLGHPAPGSPDSEPAASHSATPKAGRRLAPWLLPFFPLLGYAAYFGWMYVCTGNAFEGFDAEKSYPNSPSIRNMFNVTGFVDALSNVNNLNGMMDGAEDRLFFVAFLWLLPFIYRLDKTWFFYALPAWLVPALTSWFMSYRRYAVMLFPMFVVLALLLARLKARWLFWGFVVLLGVLQAWAVSRFINFNWAG